MPGLSLAGLSLAGHAQVIPDSTLPTNSAVPNSCSTCAITGGTLSDDQQTLFHSFQQFSVPTNGTALFKSDPSVVNIVTRVTGALPSNIDGLIAAEGIANLFFLNPNGIVFGPNAVLQIPGSFIASSADSLVFSNGTEFSAIAPDAAPLLTVSTPMGLQFGTSPNTPLGNAMGTIRVEGPGNFPPTLPGLSVTPAKTLALVGQNIDIVGGTVSAPFGRLELGSVDQGTVTLTPVANGFDLELDTVQTSGAIALSQGALLNASGPGGGDIDLHGQTVLIEAGSQVLSVTAGGLAGGNLRIDATDSVTVQGASADGQRVSRLSTDTIGAGAGGSLIVNTGALRVSDRALVSASTIGSGQGGSLVLNATELIEVNGTGYDTLQALLVEGIQGTLALSAAESGLLAGSGGEGDAGQLFIDTARLHLQDGGIISTTASGNGAGGHAEIMATESVDIIGAIILTGSLQGTTQNAGDLRLDTQRLSLRDGGLLQTFTFGAGDGGELLVNASDSVELLSTPMGAVAPTGIFANSIFGTGSGGDIDVNTGQLTIAGGAQIGNQTGAFLGTGIIPVGGTAGDVILNISGTTTIAGVSPDGRFGSGPGTASYSGSAAGDVVLTTGSLFISGGANISTTTFSDGDGGRLSVTVADVLAISGTGTRTSAGVPITLPSSLVSSSGRADFPGVVGSGAAGQLEVSAGELIVRGGGAIALDSQGSGDAGTLTAIADSIRLDNGGTINAATATGAGGNVVLQTPMLLLRQGSSINTDAGNANGGNITLDVGILIALENSDITANALQGRGGQVTVTAQSLFGTAFRERLTGESDITATSALGPEFNGEVVLNTPNIDPESGLVRLPTIASDPEDQIEAGCVGDRGNQFVIGGQGGLPTAPNRRLNSSMGWQDLRFVNKVAAENGPSVDEEQTRGMAGLSAIAQAPSIREASQVVTNEQGEIMLVAPSPNRLNLTAQGDTPGECAAHRNS
ncbi:MAG: filamentous hemagglutinin N-terminal domain-containing protein [Cyanobacteria bacterium J06598_3]